MLTSRRGAWLLIAIAVLPLAGCRAQRLAQELLERELRWQEDELYNLEDELDEMHHQLVSCRRENETLRSENERLLDGDGSGRSAPSVELPGSSLLSPPSVTPPPGMPARPGRAPAEQAPPYQGPPVIDPLEPDPADGEPPLFNGAPVITPGNRTAGDPPMGDQPPPSDQPAGDQQVSQITLNRSLTGGHNRDGHEGDDGVLVVVEPRDGAGQVINAPGTVSIVVVDPSIPGPRGKIGRWDFPEAEVAHLYREGVIGRGLRFELPWSNQPPAHGNLQLHVRFITPDGRKLTVNRPIKIDTLPHGGPGWAAAPPGSDAPPADSSGDRTEGAPSDAPPGSFMPASDVDRSPANGESGEVPQAQVHLEPPVEVGRTERPQGEAPPPRSGQRGRGWAPYR